MSPQPGKALNSGSERRRRRFARYRAEFPVTLTLLSGGEHQSLHAHCRDLSSAGIGLLLAAELVAGDVAALRFALPGLESGLKSLTVQAVLRHRRGCHYGFEFLSLTEEDAKVLANFLRKLEPLDSDMQL